MPNGRTHAFLGIGAGVATGLVFARKEPAQAKLLVAFGAAIGGYAGGILPDALEPAVHPHHRDFCHSVVLSGGLLVATAVPIKLATAHLLAGAAQLQTQRAALQPGDPNRFWLGTQQALCYILAGLMVGFVGGYLSHVAADATTERSIPLVSRRFI